jgi:SAM-dependent methyltransferase
MTGAPAIFDRRLLRERRDRTASGRTDDFLLARWTEDLLDRLAAVRRDFAVAVALGSGDGMIAEALARRSGTRLVVRTDASHGRLVRSGGPAVQADEEWLPFADASLDLVVSGLVLHHVNDLPGALIQIRRALRPDGLMIAGLFGGATLHELRDCLMRAEIEIAGGASPRIAPFADVRALGGLLQRAGFALPVADADTFTATYPSALHLVREIRRIGPGNVLSERRRRPMTRRLLTRTAEIYAERHAEAEGRVRATFEIVTLTGWAPAESQPKPLRPGSAARRLADALATREHSAGERAGGSEADA